MLLEQRPRWLHFGHIRRSFDSEETNRYRALVNRFVSWFWTMNPFKTFRTMGTDIQPCEREDAVRSCDETCWKGGVFGVVRREKWANYSIDSNWSETIRDLYRTNTQRISLDILLVVHVVQRTRKNFRSRRYQLKDRSIRLTFPLSYPNSKCSYAFRFSSVRLIELRKFSMKASVIWQLLCQHRYQGGNSWFDDLLIWIWFVDLKVIWWFEMWFDYLQITF